MSTLFNHVVIPVTILLIFSRGLNLDHRKILLLSIFSVLPDADAIFLPHRALFHNVLILIIPLFLFILVKTSREVFGLISFFIASHLLLDLFDSGIFLLYPFYDKVFYARIELLFSMETFKPVFEYGISDQIMNGGRGEPVISSENIAVAFIAFFAIMFSKLINSKKKELNTKTEKR